MVLLPAPLADAASEPRSASVAPKLALASYGLAELAMYWYHSGLPFVGSLSVATGSSAFASALLCLVAVYYWAIVGRQ